ncbi:conserved hypothetical protein [Archaeoglobus fulgidus DSM 4304]|jgi:hypothetical protein|uniref:Uncharacterized protein AF_2174 n=3 Tax=Archaeoglobus fulgidus TaxID=2234 RepID=Y2174_ARCFU|nr:RecName: Full=Uncharacterized protein AF_2174 [Archaeoglobus fulgidus DSM 4304]AAB89090.1 conserved hypothetical protein [Archaeoglobus fulgidus DSM 4304]AIG99162.1 hypothetical protein AFULGI_00024450 [Archaeoglobus fulgidus DSM 8774]KUJ93348.1 MAG: hypothetical protein XD40_1485 [Archaeoglobus fulgidus]MDI3498188.1 hypothetical protein [Archaeoglobus sp.]
MLFEIFEELEINREIRNLAYEFVKKMVYCQMTL